jgi:hypothetical protein
MWNHKFHYRVYYSSPLVPVLCISSDLLLVCLSFMCFEQPPTSIRICINAIRMNTYIRYALLHLLHCNNTCNIMIKNHRTVCCVYFPDRTFVLIYYLYWQNTSVYLITFSSIYLLSSIFFLVLIFICVLLMYLTSAVKFLYFLLFCCCCLCCSCDVALITIRTSIYSVVW